MYLGDIISKVIKKKIFKTKPTRKHINILANTRKVLGRKKILEVASFSSQAHTKHIQEFPYFEFIRHYEIPKLLIVEEQANQTTAQACLLGERRQKRTTLFELTTKIILDFSTIFHSPSPFQSLSIPRAI